MKRLKPLKKISLIRSLNKIITEELSDKLKKIASLRNIIIHKYWQIDDRKVFKSTKENIGDFDEFLRQINDFLKGS